VSQAAATTPSAGSHGNDQVFVDNDDVDNNNDAFAVRKLLEFSQLLAKCAGHGTKLRWYASSKRNRVAYLADALHCTPSTENKTVQWEQSSG
jgi:hypothetical protein